MLLTTVQRDALSDRLHAMTATYNLLEALIEALIEAHS